MMELLFLILIYFSFLYMLIKIIAKHMKKLKEYLMNKINAIKKNKYLLIVIALCAIFTSLYMTNEKFKQYVNNIVMAKAGSNAVISVSEDGKKYQLDGMRDKNTCAKHSPWGVPYREDAELFKQALFLCNSLYASMYMTEFKVPLWTSEVVTKNSQLSPRLNKIFTLNFNPNIPENYQIKFADYANSIYYPAKMAATENMGFYDEYGTDENIMSNIEIAKEESFYLTNTAPQNKDLNLGLWKDLETYIRKQALLKGQLFVTTGLLFLEKEKTKTLGESKILIPSHFYKIVTDNSNNGTVVFIIPNVSIETSTYHPQKSDITCSGGCTLNNFIVSFKELEKLSNFRFYPWLDSIYAVQVKLDPAQASIKPNYK